jgi:hypothetical protein
LRAVLQRSVKSALTSEVNTETDTGREKPLPEILTSGEIVDDSLIELVANARTGGEELLLCTGEARSKGRRIEHSGHVYVAMQLELSLRRCLSLPAETADYGSTSRLFDAIKSVFLKAGFSLEISETASFFVLASWVAELLPQAPCLLITGARAEGLHLLEVLACLTRRPLPLLAPGSIAALAPVLSTGLAPTLLINAEMLHHEKLGFWLTSTARSARVIVAGKLVDISAARVIFVGESLESPPLDQPMLVVNTETSDGLLPVISRDRQAELASRFQPQLLEYRVRNFVKIRASTADLPGAPAAIRISARILGAIALDAPELQACSRRVLDHLQGIHANQFWLDPRALVIEAALARCHDPGKQRSSSES